MGCWRCSYLVIDWCGELILLVINMVPTMVNLNFSKCCTHYTGALSLLVVNVVLAMMHITC